LTAFFEPVPEPARPLEVLLVDDHRIFAEVLALRLKAESAVSRVERATTLRTAHVLLSDWRPDLVLLDFHLGEESGLDLLRELAPDGPAVIMVSGEEDVGSIIAAIEAGAHGWVSKCSPVALLLTAAAVVSGGNMFLPPALLRPVLRQIIRDHRADTQPGLLDDVTPRELEVLRCLVAGMSRAEVASRLFLSTNTVRTHMQNLLRRAEVHSTLALVAAARDMGITGIDEPEPVRGRRQSSY
jgi:two-component system nitrate/nitrite response regulator NarL